MFIDDVVEESEAERVSTLPDPDIGGGISCMMTCSHCDALEGLLVFTPSELK